MPTQALRLLVIGAHPDDAEYRAGGLAALYRRAGHEVRFVSLTSGDAGHHEIGGVQLARRRRAEAAAAAALIAATCEVWEHHDGELLPTLDIRKQVIRLLRRYRPDLVLTHRPNDYHPDHRYTSQLVQDAAYMVTVPNLCSDTPHLDRDPLIMYLADEFEKPWPFRPAVAVDVTPVWATKIAMLHCHVSQFYEWLPYNLGRADVPAGDAARQAWLDEWIGRVPPVPTAYPELLERRYGIAQLDMIRHIEAFEPCEYGRPLDEERLATLFPMFG